MTVAIGFTRFAAAHVVPDHGVFLMSEHRQLLLRGALIERMAPLLDGSRTRAEVIGELAGAYEADAVERALGLLAEAGHVVEMDPGTDRRAAGYWERTGLNGDMACDAVRTGSVRLLALGGTRREWFTGAADEVGLRLGGAEADITVVLTDHYLHSELASINRTCLREGRPWLLAKPTGTTIWVGPLFQPGRSACWTCLEHRLRGHHPVASFVRQVGGLPELPLAATDVPATVAIAVRLAALEAQKWLAGARAEEGAVITLDTLTLTPERHAVQPRPQCPECGTADTRPERIPDAVRFTDRVKTATSDGGHRARDPERFLADYQHLVSPVTGLVPRLVKQEVDTDLLHTYTAGHNFAARARDLDGLRTGLRMSSGGKGRSDLQAKAGALAEAIERYSGVFQGDEPRVTGSLRSLGDRAIHPNAVYRYSDRQISERDSWNSGDCHFHWVVEAFDENARMEWSPVWSLTEQRHKYLPTGSLYYQYPDDGGVVKADSNGAAAGSSLEDAALQGFLELVERDSVAIWWYNRISRPGVDLAGFGDDYFTRWQHEYRRMNRETWVIDLTSDLGIPVAAAVSRRYDKPAEDILIAFGAHFDMRIAISRAMTEMNQFLPAVLPMRADGTGSYAYDDPYQVRWWRTATTVNQPYLLPHASLPARTAADYSYAFRPNLRDDLLEAQRIVESKGMEMLVLDQTRPDTGLPVVKVIVPGMRHFWPRYAPGRLYDVPVELGWLPEPLAEDQLNPIGVFV
ncbi:TOMM precursor leader peptide-binding protein [Nonomuraea sp. NPDC005983]|uniref:TOMM precursor leader peptide-binding protein n=1 Tax=Nonomuraea sp. NPDC005983 TaxID=3155595 RepID=UPI0033A0D3ED